MVGGVPRSLKGKGPSKKEMGKAYESTIKAILEEVDSKQKGMVDQINKILAEFQSQIQQTLAGQSQNFVGAIQRSLDIAYTGDVHLTVIRKFLFEKLGVSEEEYNVAIEAEVQLREETRKRQIEEHNARLAATKEAAEKALAEQEVKDDGMRSKIQEQLTRLCFTQNGVNFAVQNDSFILRHEGHEDLRMGAGLALQILESVGDESELSNVDELYIRMAAPETLPPEIEIKGPPLLGTVTEDNEPVMFGGDYQPEGKPVPESPIEEIVMSRACPPDCPGTVNYEVVSEELDRLGVVSYSLSQGRDGMVELDMGRYPRIVEMQGPVLSCLRTLPDGAGEKAVYVALRGETPSVGEVLEAMATPRDPEDANEIVGKAIADKIREEINSAPPMQALAEVMSTPPTDPDIE